MRRSNHIAIHVPEDQVEAAVAHYIAVLGASEKSRSEEGIELEGANFTLWLMGSDEPEVYQEFVTKDRPGAQRLIAEHGLQVAEETPYGVMVRDPYGLKYHIFIEES